MRKLILVTFLLPAFAFIARGQCPTAGFNVPDSVCTGSGFQVSNTSTGASSYFWDFCPGDISTTPVLSLLPVDPGINLPQQLRVIRDGSQYHLFVTNYSSNQLIRYDFGTSLDNVPVAFDYGNIGGLLSQPVGLDVINDNGTWYALLCNSSSGAVIRVDLGSVISGNTASAVNLGQFGLSAPTEVTVAQDGSDFYAFVTSGPNSVIKINFGNSMANTPSGFTTLSDPSFGTPWGFDIAFDCSINKWVGFCASYSLNQISVIDFGSSLANLGNVVSTYPCIPSPTGMGVVRDGSKWYLMINSITSFVLERLQRIELSGSLVSTPASSFSFYDAQLTSPRGISIIRVESSFRAFIASNSPNNIMMLDFEQPCSTVPEFSTDPVSVNVTASTINSYQEILLEAYGPGGEITYYSDSIFVLEVPEAGFVSSAACEGQAVLFTDTSLVNPNLNLTWQWDFGDLSPTSSDQNPSHIFTGTGTFTVTLVVEYETGCSDTISETIVVNPIPLADFSFANNQCTEVPVLFTDLSQAFGGAVITTWSWDFGDANTSALQNPQHVYTAPGNYDVQLVVETNTGCVDTIIQTITILPSPVADFTISSTCVGEIAVFNNLTTISGGGSISYSWDFGDSFTSPLEDPTHQYASVAANYFVTLIATAANLCKDTIILDIRIGNKPVPQFTYSPAVVCKFNQVTFTNTSFGIGGDTISSYLWDFGDTGTSTDENPFHAYSDTGFFSVTLTVVSPTACDSSISQQVYVIPSPTATFSGTNVCLGFDTEFSPSTTTPPTTQIDSIVWDFGDGATFTGLTSPTHLYSLPGTYGVTMTVYNNLLCTATYTDSVEVYPIPVASFTTSLACSGSDISFDGSTSTVAGDSLTSWLWDFDGMGIGTGEVTTFSFPNAGDYDVTLVVSSFHGCLNLTTTTVTVLQSPVFDFVFNEPCFGLPSNFTYIPLISPPPNVSLSWDLGDGTTSLQSNPFHVYATIDTFMVSLTVLQNSTGCSAVIEHPLIIKPYPDAGFSFINNCEDLPVQFTDTSDIVTGSIISWDWDFGLLGSSSIFNPVITPADAGSYPISLTVTSDEGCASEITDTLTVFQNPVAAFTPDPVFGSPPLTVNFINSSTGGVVFDWNFGDGSTGSGASVTHEYQDTGLYNISLIVTSAEGCLNTTSGVVSVLIPFLDIGVNKIFITEDNELLTVRAELLNVGNVPVNDLQIAANIQNGSLINEVWTGDFQPGEVLIYTFNARYDISSKSFPGFYCVSVSAPNGDVDQNPANDNKCAVIGSEFEVFSISPNPFNDEFALNFNLPDQGEYDVTVFDMAGKLVYESQPLTGLKGYNKLVIPSANFAKGLYGIVVRYRDEVKTINALKY